jgi:hypothetical protein
MLFFLFLHGGQRKSMKNIVLHGELRQPMKISVSVFAWWTAKSYEIYFFVFA